MTIHESASAARAFADAVLTLYRDEIARGGSEAQPLREAMAHLSIALAMPMRITRPERLPVCGHLPAALTALAAGPLSALAPSFAAFADLGCWWQNANYRARPPFPGFLDKYASLELAGLSGPLPSERVAIGVILLGPNLDYPSHVHPADEVYHVLSGNAGWWMTGLPWRDLPAGTCIHHPSGIEHAMRMGDAPLLALYSWTGDIATPPSFAGQAP